MKTKRKIKKVLVIRSRKSKPSRRSKYTSVTSGVKTNVNIALGTSRRVYSRQKPNLVRDTGTILNPSFYYAPAYQQPIQGVPSNQGTVGSVVDYEPVSQKQRVYNNPNYANYNPLLDGNRNQFYTPYAGPQSVNTGDRDGIYSARLDQNTFTSPVKPVKFVDKTTPDEAPPIPEEANDLTGTMESEENVSLDKPEKKAEYREETPTSTPVKIPSANLSQTGTQPMGLGEEQRQITPPTSVFSSLMGDISQFKREFGIEEGGKTLTPKEMREFNAAIQFSPYSAQKPVALYSAYTPQGAKFPENKGIFQYF